MTIYFDLKLLECINYIFILYLQKYDLKLFMNSLLLFLYFLLQSANFSIKHTKDIISYYSYSSIFNRHLYFIIFFLNYF